jgi:hypothetical protein
LPSSSPDHVSKGALRVARMIASIAERRIYAGWSLAYAFRTAALGRDLIVTELQKYGHTADRKTVASCLLELAEAGVIERTGQLRGWTDPDAQDDERVHKSGAFTYRLRIRFRQLGDLALNAVLRLSSSASPWGNTTLRRAERALEWALGNAKPGHRNRIGHWLACRCRDAGLTEGDAGAVMGRYVAGVDQSGPSRPYEADEAGRTLASVYRK